MLTKRFVLGSVVGALFLACGGGGNAPPAVPTPDTAVDASAPSAPTASAPTASTAAPAADAAAPAPSATSSAGVSATLNWDALSHEEKLEHMKKVVLPKMKALFQAQDAKKYERFNCGTCHGQGAKDGTYAMPNPKLPVLTGADNFKKHMTSSPEMTKFMMDKVKPEMAAAINEKPMDASGKGFGCGECHTFAK